ncbi:MAG TPA: hypothetical protein VNR64_09570 [Vicinamibacterales bacterium]|nr:hypothetical protein [Vicinamibacterales bacterium]
MNMTWSCSRCHGIWRQRSRVRWYELWLRAVSASRPFCCTTCGRRAWSAVPEDAAPVNVFTAPVDEVHEVSLAAVDAILSDVPPAGHVADLEHLSFDDPPPARPRHRRAARKRARTGSADASVH